MPRNRTTQGNLLRVLLLSLSRAAWEKRLVTRWKAGRQIAARFVAGEMLADALQVTSDLNANGLNVTLDHLGEHTSTSADAVQATEAILALLDTLRIRPVRANVSIN